MDNFTRGYIECALWVEAESLEHADTLAPATRERMIADCAKFQQDNAALLSQISTTADYQGHDFWLTRNHHGAGFWGRGLGEVGEALTRAAHMFGSHELYVGDDGLIHGV